MANWYNIPGIELIWTAPRDADNHILFEGIEDDSCVTVEDTMWSMYNEEVPEPDDCRGDNWGVYVDRFVDYMLENADEVKNLIRMARGQIEY